MSIALHLYEELSKAKDDQARARIIAEALEQLEERFPQVRDLATQTQLRETELRLKKEIEQIRLELEQLRQQGLHTKLELENRIDQTRLELEKQIEETRLGLEKQIEQVKLEIKAVEVRFTQALHRQTLWIIGSVGAIIGLIRILEWFLTHLA